MAKPAQSDSGIAFKDDRARAARKAVEKYPRDIGPAAVPALGESPSTQVPEKYPRDIGPAAVPALGESPPPQVPEKYPRDIGPAAVPALGESPSAHPAPTRAVVVSKDRPKEVNAPSRLEGVAGAVGEAAGSLAGEDVGGRIQKYWKDKIAAMPTPLEIDAATPLQ